MAFGYDTTTTSPDSTLGYLQELLLSAVMLGERLPGARRPIRLPARGGTLANLPSKILRLNLAQSLKLDELPRRLDALSVEQLKVEEHLLVDENFSFLAFRPVVWGRDRVELSMVIGGMSRADGSWQCRELGHVDAQFHEREGRWAAVNEPHVFLER
jgi:hypothetical protein